MIANRWVDVILVMVANPPDPNEPLPFANRRETICGVVLTFLVLSLLSVGFRLYVRCFVVREPGWDDVFVFLSAVCASIGISHVAASAYHGLGNHFLYLGQETMEMYLKITYIANGFYITAACLIKISLLLQYLRIFKAGIMRTICLVLMTLTILWGIAFGFLAWFGCLPPRGFWDSSVEATCYGFGFGENGINGFVAAFEAHASTNMALDLAIFMVPLVLFKRSDLKPRTVLAMGGMFLCGAVVVTVAAWRLYTIVDTGAGMRPYPDPTWFTPIFAILSGLEMELAMICASMPIFWPMIENSLAAIFVSYDVEIVEQRISHGHSRGGGGGSGGMGVGLAYELEHTDSRGSRKSSSASTQELTHGAKTQAFSYSVGLDPLDTEAQIDMGPQTHINSEPAKPKWEI